MRRALQSKRAAKARLLLIEPLQVVREGVRGLINREPDLEVCGEATENGAALEAIARLKPDLVLSEITLKQGNGLELIRILAGQQPPVPVLVLSMHDEGLYAELALRAGAMGYVMKTETIETVIRAVRRVLSGKIYLSDLVTTQMLRQQIRGRNVMASSPVAVLTDRELQVFQLIGAWHRTKEIAAELNLSVKTVEYHREQIREKLHLKDSSEVVRYATECAAGKG